MATLHSRLLVAGLVVVGAFYSANPAYAEAESVGTTERGITSSQRQATAADMFGNAALGNDMLETSRGGTDIELNKITSDGVVRDNQAYNLTTGSNLITEGAFSAANGFSTVIQNSGNNVLIQNSTIINLQMQ